MKTDSLTFSLMVLQGRNLIQVNDGHKTNSTPSKGLFFQTAFDERGLHYIIQSFFVSVFFLIGKGSASRKARR